MLFDNMRPLSYADSRITRACKITMHALIVSEEGLCERQQNGVRAGETCLRRLNCKIMRCEFPRYRPALSDARIFASGLDELRKAAARHTTDC